MRLDIQATNVRMTTGLRDHIVRRAYFCLARFGERVASLNIRLSDDNGPRRGQDRVCRISARLRGGAPFVVEDRDARLTLAVDSALRRTARSVARRLERIDDRWRYQVRAWERRRAGKVSRGPAGGAWFSGDEAPTSP